MQLERALRALPFRIETWLQHGTAIRTARASDGANHAGRSRPDLFLPRMTFVVLALFFLGLVVTLVAPVFILPVQGNLRAVVPLHSESEHADRTKSRPVNAHKIY
jgi:hypothetical protein